MNSITIGKIEKAKKMGQMIMYLHESRMNQIVNRHPRKCRMIWSKLNLAKIGVTLVPAIMRRNSKMHRPIIV